MSTAQTVTPTAESLAGASLEFLAPPFTAPWSRLQPAAPPPGFWTAIRHDPSVGGVVMQLGAQAHPSTYPGAYGLIQVGYRRSIELGAGVHNLTARFELGSVSLRPNGGQLNTSVFIDVRGPGTPVTKYQQVFGAGVFYMSAFLWLAQPALYTLTVGGSIASFYQGAANPYAEIIIRRTEVTRQGPSIYPDSSVAESLRSASELEIRQPDDKDLRIEAVDPSEILPAAFA